MVASLVGNSSAPTIFGCSTCQSGDLTKTDRVIDGIIGFGQQDLSITSQLASRGITPKVFSLDICDLNHLFKSYPPRRLLFYCSVFCFAAKTKQIVDLVDYRTWLCCLLFMSKEILYVMVSPYCLLFIHLCCYSLLLKSNHPHGRSNLS